MITREKLFDLYVTQDLDRLKIANILGISEHTVKRNLKKYGVKKPEFEYNSNVLSKDWLYEEFVVKHRTASDIASEVGHTQHVILSQLKKLGVKRLVKRNIDSRINDPVFLYQKIVIDGESQKDLAKLLSTNVATVRRYLIKHNLTRDNILDNGPYKKLYDKDWLESERKEKTLKNIAIEQGVSPSCVEKACRIQEISTKPPSTVSSYENEICDYLASHNIEFERRNRKILSGKELDIFIPSKNLALEINGTYWHCSDKILDEKYHQNKTLECKNAGIRLFHIWEHDFVDQDKKTIIFSKLDYFLGIQSKLRKIRASKCRVENINNQQYSKFVDQNHIQGSQQVCSVRLGLYEGTELVAVMGFTKPRFSKKYDFELMRFCTRNGCVVHGAASKLWKHFREKNPNKSIISYCDMDYGTGEMYTKLGMSYQGTTRPNYTYFKQSCFGKDFVVLSRYQCQKHKLEKLLGSENFNSSLTEKQNMAANGFRTFYNSGSMVFVTTN